MELTINDVEKIDFPGGLFGYSKKDVEAFRKDVLETLRAYVDEISELKKEIKRLNEELERYKASENLLKESVILAQKTREEIIASARKEAEILVKEAQDRAKEVARDIAQIESERERFEFEFYGLLKGFMEKLEARRMAEHPQAKGLSASEVAAEDAGTQIKEMEQKVNEKGEKPLTNKEESEAKALESETDKPKETLIFPEEPLH